MARPSTYSEVEDRIILRYANRPAPVVNAALLRAGFPERTPQQLSQRRYYLRRRRPVEQVARSNGNAIIALETERRELLREIQTLDQQREKLESRLLEITEELAKQVRVIEADVERVRSSRGTAASSRSVTPGSTAVGDGDAPGVGHESQATS